jgi:hypothetical protein
LAYRFWIGIVLVLAGVALLVLADQRAPAAPGAVVAFVGATVRLPEQAVAVRVDDGSPIAVSEADSSKQPVARLTQIGRHRIDSFSSLPDAAIQKPLASISVVVLAQSVFLLALGGLTLVVLGLPLAFGLGHGVMDAEGKGVGAWAQLLSEPLGGYSLARVQLLLWSLPTSLIWGALSLLRKEFVPFDETVALLLGLSGATTLLGTATSPNQEVARRAASSVARPRLRDLLRDWNGSADLSRYQYLVLTLIGSAVLARSMFHDLQVPQIPQGLLLTLGASQATYLGTKAAKASKGEEARTLVAPPAAPLAPPNDAVPATATFLVERV